MSGYLQFQFTKNHFSVSDWFFTDISTDSCSVPWLHLEVHLSILDPFLILDILYYHPWCGKHAYWHYHMLPALLLWPVNSITCGALLCLWKLPRLRKFITMGTKDGNFIHGYRYPQILYSHGQSMDTFFIPMRSTHTQTSLPRAHLLLPLSPEASQGKSPGRGGGGGLPWSPWSHGVWRTLRISPAMIQAAAAARAAPGCRRWVGCGEGRRDVSSARTSCDLHLHLVPLMAIDATPGLGMHHEGAGGFGPVHCVGGLLHRRRWSAGRIKVAVLGFLSRQRSTCCMPSLTWPECRVPKGTIGEIH
jgi:hypothetical protein